MRIYCDFDGTISRIDTTDHILSLFADPAWAELEADWIAGRTTAAACMSAQVALLKVSDAELDAALDGVELAPGFTAFAAWCAGHGIALTIVSDGVDRFIRRILGRHGLDGLPVVSNRLIGDETLRGLDQPWRREGCAAGSGVCKCGVVEASSDPGPVVYVGDGRSDFCASARAEILFAKGALAQYAVQRGRAFHPFDDFHDVTAALRLVRAARQVAAG